MRVAETGHNRSRFGECDTGRAKRSREEMEYIGNIVDSRLRDFSQQLGKAMAAAKKRAQRASKAGIQGSSRGFKA